jgi:uncharacterized protein (DUF4415 family)
MRPAHEVLPAPLYDGLTRGRAGRPPKADRKDRDIVDDFRATGEGWQTRINDTLRRALVRLKALG